MRFIMIALLSLGLSGCLADVLMTTAIQGEMQAKQAGAAQNVLNHVKDDTAEISLQRAVNAYNGEKGYYPESLDELVPSFIDPIPQRADGGNFGYNPITGRISDNDSGPSAAGYFLVADTTAAIKAYG
ncbi:MAG: hypothetical protein L3K26_11555, partial [Candidatus Hydrogenedentes bacterium]|nr:hypothetical protein [Candidatus Hydrogenedentota bacterium]